MHKTDFTKTDKIMHTQSPALEQAGPVLDPLGDKISSLELIRVSGGDLDIVNAARVSFGKFANKQLLPLDF